MKKYGKVRSTKQPEQKVIDDYSVWIAENITPVTEAGTDEQPGFTGYEYDLTQYTKDEYIKMIDDRNASLEDQMTQAQEAMCEIYEMMAEGRGENMANIYAALIIKGKKSINDVPDKIRGEVKQVLIDEGHPELAEGGN